MLPPLTFDAPPAAALRLSVVLPVRDEAAWLPQTLAKLGAQADSGGRPLDPGLYEVLLLANNCRDDTAAVARRFAQNHPRLALRVAERDLPAGQADVGTARRLLMDAARRRFRALGRPGGVIASTDGDTSVAPDWVAQTLREIAGGADAVGGRILVAGHEDAGSRRYHLRDVTYHWLRTQLEAGLDPDPHDPWPRHHQFFGASLAVTAEAYGAVGGLPPVPCLEDVALGRALRRIDARIRHSPHVRVTSSARQSGRTGLGLATQLREWSDMAQASAPHRVPDPAALAVRFRSRARLRRLWRDARAGRCPQHGDVVALAEALCVPVQVLRGGLIAPCEPFGSLWKPVQQAHETPDGPWACRWPLLPVTAAITDLRARLSAHTHPGGSSPRGCR